MIGEMCPRTTASFGKDPSLFPLTAGECIDPEVLGTQVGYVYASWLATKQNEPHHDRERGLLADGQYRGVPCPNTWRNRKVGNRPVVGMAVELVEAYS